MRKKSVNSIFVKMTIAFILIGMLPILILSQIFFKKYSNNMKNVTISHMEQMVYYVSKHMEDILKDVDNGVSSVYGYSFGKYKYLYDILNDRSISEQVKSSYMNEMLGEILNKSEYISSVRFKGKDGDVYTVYKDKLKNLKNGVGFANELIGVQVDQYRDLFVIPAVKESRYCINSNDYIFTVARNYMDCSVVENSRTIVLGTIYADIDVNVIDNLNNKVTFKGDGEMYIVDLERDEYIYSSDIERYEKKDRLVSSYKDSIQGSAGYIIRGKKYIIYSNIMNTNLYVIKEINEWYMLGSYFSDRASIIIILGSGLFIIFCIYLSVSKSFNNPVKDLKMAMEEIQIGNLGARVNIKTKDEFQSLGDGFNKMAEDLNKYINQVYKASIEQKEIELKALKMQIQPHYLYNTLDVIRMKAIENKDFEVSKLLESLSKQLRYITNNSSDYVTLLEELNNIKEYFVIISVRYNNLYELDIDVKGKDLNLKVPKLILQPIVENSIKYGLRGRDGAGKVMIRINRHNDYLEIMIMDNGICISEEKIKEINNRCINTKDNSSSSEGGNIGIRNIYNRIKYYYGEDYGFKIEGEKGFGTIVTYRLPIMED